MSTDPSTPENDANLSGLGRALLETGGSKLSSGPWVPPSAEELGKLLPEYDIVKMLGRGGMGAVYMGRQKSLDRAVAIKIISGTLEDSDMGFKERFKNEARAMGKLNFAGIVAVHDFGEAKGGLLYIVMEYVEGTDVARMIAKEGRLHTEHAMAITAHVCDALQYAHERGIIHRDIKPANIMVGYDGVVKVADFGLAKMTHSNSTGLTQSAMTMGTLHYMAPECLMLGAAVDHRADIYAVGVMLYQMLTGKLPQGAFELPSLQIAGLDPRYDQIIAKALREDREVRYQNIRDMRCDLDAILTQPVAKVEPEVSQMPAALPTQARPQRPGGQPYRPPQSVVQHQHAPKSGGSWGWTAVLSIAVLGAGGWWLTQHRGGDLQSPGTPPGSSPSIPASAVVNTPPQVVPPTVKPASPPVKVTTTPASPALSTPAMPVPPPTSAFDLQQLPDFRTRVANYQKARHAQLAELTTKYRSALTAEKDAAIQSGVLASVTACDAAIANAATFAEVIEQNFTATEVKPLPALAAVADPDPPRLKELRDIFVREVEKIENTLIASLDQSFATVQASLVQADKLGEAKAVQGYRKSLLDSFIRIPDRGTEVGGGSSAIAAEELVLDLDFSRPETYHDSLNTKEMSDVIEGELVRRPIEKGGLWLKGPSALSRLQLDDFACEIEARLVGPKSQEVWGIGMMRREMPTHPWTGVMLRADGMAGAKLFDEGEFLPWLKVPGWSSPETKQQLRVEVRDKVVRLLVNGAQVGEKKQPRLLTSHLTLYIAGNQAAELRVSRIRVWKLAKQL